MRLATFFIMEHNHSRFDHRCEKESPHVMAMRKLRKGFRIDLMAHLINIEEITKTPLSYLRSLSEVVKQVVQL